MALIFALSAQPDVPQPFDLSAELLAIGAHLFLFGVLAVLVSRALAPQVARLGTRLALSWTFTVIYGVSDEVHQAFVPGRSATFFDVLVDAAGAAAALAALTLAARRWGQASDE
jgi:VanZ family protein